MRMIESDKVIPLMRMLLLFNPRADEICENMQEIVDIHTIDAVPVVRCKDCKYCDSARDCIHPENIHHYYDGEGYDYESFHMVDPDHFCSYGERKEAEGNG